MVCKALFIVHVVVLSLCSMESNGGWFVRHCSLFIVHVVVLSLCSMESNGGWFVRHCS